MRVLAIEPGPAFSVADVHRGWVKALMRLGCEVVNFNFEDRLNFYSQVQLQREGEEPRKALTGDEAVRLAGKGIEVVAFEWWPDLVVITSCFFVEPFILQVLRDRGMKVLMLLTESPYEDDSQLERVAYADLALVNDPLNLERFRKVNPNTYYTPHSYDPDFHNPYRRNIEKASDFCFVGTGFPSRIEFFEQVDWSGIDAMFAGNWQALKEDSPLRPLVPHPIDHCLDNAEAAELYCSTKASANLYRRESENEEIREGWAMGPREVELAACGAFFLTEARGENREVLPMVPVFKGPEDFEAKLRWYLAHPDARSKIAEKAREAITGRTFDVAASRALALL